MVSNETQNMREVSLKCVLKQIRQQLLKGNYTPVILIGKSGIGKTESLHDLASEMNIGFKELRLSHYQESDLIGLPYIDENGHTCHASSSVLPDEEDQGQGILLLDEVTAAPKSMRSAVYQLMDSSRKLGSYRLPEKWLVVACGNGPLDGGDYRGMEPAFMSRGYCWRVETDLEAWKEWAFKHDIDRSIIAFLNSNPSMLHVMDPDRPFDMIACPRNWAKLSVQLRDREEEYEGGFISDEEDILFSAEGCVGVRCGEAFATFYMHKKDLPDPQRIADGEIPVSDMENIQDDKLYLTVQMLASYMSDLITEDFNENNGLTDQCVKKTASLLKWVIDLGMRIRLDAAISLIQDLKMKAGAGFKNMVMSEKFQEECPEFAQFAVENAL